MKNKKLFITGLLFFLIAGTCHAKSLYRQSDYQQAWCSFHNGKTEAVLSDNSRADCLTKTHAIEFDFSGEWAESIGQSLYYAHETKKKAGIVLIMEKPNQEAPQLRKIIDVARKYKIDVWAMRSLDDVDNLIYKGRGLRIIK